MLKRIAVIQDLSCIGRCSLGVAMSVIPAMGIETAVLPTAILSTHTAFDRFTFLDFSAEAEKIMDCWKALNFEFDAIYIGYLGSEKLIDLAARFIDAFRTGRTRVIVDPAFGDNGSLYKIFDLNYVRGIRALCAQADVILPNVTEACYLLGIDYADDPDCVRAIEARAGEMLTGRLRSVLVTSCRFSQSETGLICVGDDAFEYPHERLNLSCHGTGDLFASVFSGLITLDRELQPAARLAADFTSDCIRYAMRCPEHRWYGVDFEPMLPELIRRLGSNA